MSIQMVSRSAWGARAPRSRSLIRLPVAKLWLHHEGGPLRDGGAQSVRDIQRYHMDTVGWSDIAYSWLYSPRYRRFYEGRGGGVAGGHTYSHNTTSHALCVIGNYDRMSLPSGAVDDIRAFRKWHGRRFGPGKFTGGHRDATDPRSPTGFARTSCPGNNLYPRISQINAEPPEDPGMTDAQFKAILDAIAGVSNQSIPLGPAAQGVFERESHRWRRVLEVAAVHAHWSNQGVQQLLARPAPASASQIAAEVVRQLPEGGVDEAAVERAVRRVFASAGQ